MVKCPRCEQQIKPKIKDEHRVTDGECRFYRTVSVCPDCGTKF